MPATSATKVSIISTPRQTTRPTAEDVTRADAVLSAHPTASATSPGG